MFHRHFPELTISASHLQRIYKRHGVKFKYIQKGKKVLDYSNTDTKALFEKMHNLVKLSELYEMKIVFVDEAVFSFNTFSTKAWAAPYRSVTVEERKIRVKTQSLVAGISADRGLESYLIHPRSISAVEFIRFLEQLSEHLDSQPFAIFLDNLSVHKTKEVQTVCKRLDITLIFNMPYSPDFNGIESYFSLVKARYKKLVLQRLLKGLEIDAAPLIRQSIAGVTNDKIMRCVSKGLSYIDEKF